jgi:hypothetical protein
MDIFLNKFRSVFSEFKSNLIFESQYTEVYEKDGEKERKALIFDPLIKQLSQQLLRMLKIVSNLERVNKQVMKANS